MATFARLHKITMLKYAIRTIKSRNVQYNTGYKSIIYDIQINIQIPAIKHDKIQFLLMRHKRGNGGGGEVQSKLAGPTDNVRTHWRRICREPSRTYEDLQ